ncbi:MAG: hypothetical protein WCO52_04660 [bacterium]
MTLLARLENLGISLIIALLIVYVGLWVTFRFFPGVLPRSWGKWLRWPKKSRSFSVDKAKQPAHNKGTQSQ